MEQPGGRNCTWSKKMLNQFTYCWIFFNSRYYCLIVVLNLPEFRHLFYPQHVTDKTLASLGVQLYDTERCQVEVTVSNIMKTTWQRYYWLLPAFWSTMMWHRLVCHSLQTSLTKKVLIWVATISSLYSWNELCTHYLPLNKFLFDNILLISSFSGLCVSSSDRGL